MKRGEILDTAKALINGDRQDQYGKPEDSFDTISRFWNTYLVARTRANPTAGVTMTPKDVCIMMALLKIAREAHQDKQDNLVDVAGYIGLAGDM